MADWDGLRRELESSVTPPPLDALRERRHRRERRRTVALSSALALVMVGSGAAVVARTAGRTGRRAPATVAGAGLDPFVLGDREPPPRDYADFVVTDVDFVSASTGWAIGLRCAGDACDVATWRTSDGGLSWEPRVTVAHGVPRASFAAQDPAGGGARSLRMVNEREGYAFNPDLYATRDGGRTWRRLPQPHKVAGVLVQRRSVWVFQRGCAPEDDCDGVLRAGTVGAESDLGTYHLPPTGGADTMLRRATESVGYLLSWNGPGAALRETHDGGLTWNTRTNPCQDATAESLSAGASRPLWLVCTVDGGRRAYRSSDGGATWRRSADPPAAGDVTDLVAPSATTAYLTTQQPAALLVTRDAGATWAPAPGTARTGYGYGNLDVTDATHAWAMGDAGILWRTTDGIAWERRTLPPGAPRATGSPATTPPAPLSERGVAFTGLFFLDASRGWALGRRCAMHTCFAVMRRTSDGGRTWQAAGAPHRTWDDQQPLMPGEVRSVTFADERNGWAYGPGFWATHDGGATWREVLQATVREVLVRGSAVWLVAYNSCASMDCEPSVLRATVGSDTFTGPDDSPIKTRAELAAPDATHAYLVEIDPGEHPSVVATADRGRTWVRHEAPCANAYRRAAAAAGTLWVVCEYDGGGGSAPIATARSTDGGAHWTTTPKRVEQGYPSVLVPLSGTAAWRADDGVGEGIRSTSDGGATWHTYPLPDNDSGGGGPYAFGMLDARHGWALFANNTFLRTDDGATWVAMTPP